MQEIALNDRIIEKVKEEVPALVQKLMQDDLIEIILYGSCARGDYTEDSDVDIALIVKSDRIEAKKYVSGLTEIATEFAMKYFAVVNFVCLPYQEFSEKKDWYMYFQSIEKEGQVLYGARIL